MLKLIFTEETIAELKYERYHHPHPRVQMKMEALLLKAAGLPHQQIAACVGVSAPTLRSYLSAYQAGGIGALRTIKFPSPDESTGSASLYPRSLFYGTPPSECEPSRGGD